MILVTGGTGFIGSHLLVKLAQETDLPIRALYRNEEKIKSNRVLQTLANPERIEWVKGDVLDIFSLEDALQNVEQVYHCAAVVSFHHSRHHEMEQANIQGTANIVDGILATERAIRLLYASSIAALGRSEESNWIDEQTEWKDSPNNSQYAITKFKSEMEVWRGIEEGLNAVIVNPSVVLGVGDYNASTGMLFTTVWKGLPVYPSGATGYVDVRDVVGCMHQLMQSSIRGQRFVLNGENCSYKDFFTLMAKELDKKPPSYMPPQWMSEIGWRVLEVYGKLTNKAPFITKETSRTSYQLCFYKNQKVVETLNHSFIPLEYTIRHVAKDFKEWLNEKNA